MKLFKKKKFIRTENAVCIYGPPEMLEKYRNKSNSSIDEDEDNDAENEKTTSDDISDGEEKK